MEVPKVELVYRSNLYWGIRYDLDLEATVCEVASGLRKYADLGGERREIQDKKNIYFRSANSDSDDNVNCGFIAVDEMTVEGEAFDRPEDVCLAFEATNLVKLEGQNAAAMEFITTLYDAIIARLKKDRVDYNGRIWIGWSQLTCSWDETSPESDEDASAEEKPKQKPAKSAEKQKQKPKQKVKSGNKK
jgi:hypothetical protein